MRRETMRAMLTVTKLIAQGKGLAPVLLKRAGTVELDWAQRRQARGEVADSLGRTLKLALPEGSTLRGGDVLVAEDGSMIRVQAAAQPVLVVRPCAAHGGAVDLQRAAYHLGRRQVALQLAADHLALEPDPALRAWLQAMHLEVSQTQAAFEPEGDAAAHDHGHPPGHEHGHEHTRDHGHHGQACGHDHDHGHGQDAHEHHPHGHHGHDHGGRTHRH